MLKIINFLTKNSQIILILKTQTIDENYLNSQCIVIIPHVAL